ncbi:MucR family transcriptional regulator [Phenylobacterium sp.]|jgi:predicted transcriptional regulator|uniref:MucR family transcriptional regulator n=1 Tax=Phenylobacterium sp. TaxID=1871053 RepID=UPI002F91DF2B
MSTLKYAADIVASYLENNKLAASELPQFLISVHQALEAAGTPAGYAEIAPKLSPQEVRRSIRRDALVSFLDGRPYKALKRHLTANGLTPDEYRERFGLPADYPMVAPAYSAARSELAKSLGLGQRRRIGKQNAKSTAAKRKP